MRQGGRSPEARAFLTGERFLFRANNVVGRIDIGFSELFPRARDARATSTLLVPRLIPFAILIRESNYRERERERESELGTDVTDKRL